MSDDPQADPLLIGNLSDEEKGEMDKLRQSHQMTLLRIGQLEVQKRDMLTALDLLDKQGNDLSARIGQRLGITAGVKWNANPDGTVRLVPQPIGTVAPVDAPAVGPRRPLEVV
jgi:hypothetical protein